MSLLFIDGFSHYGTDAYVRKWDNGSSLDADLDFTGGRRGGGCAYMHSFTDNLAKTFPGGAAATVIVGFAIKVESLAADEKSILDFETGSGTVQTSVIINTDGTLAFRRGGTTILTGGTSSYVIPLGEYVYLEAKITFSQTLGVAVLHADGVEIVNAATSQATLTEDDTVVRLRFSNSPDDYSTPGDYRFCDFYLCDALGTTNNDFLGDCRVDTLFPDADSTPLDFTPSSAVAHYTLVDGAAASLTSYVGGGTVGHRENFSMSPLPALSVPTVFGVQVVSTSYMDTGARTVANAVKSGATTTDSSTSSVATSTWAPWANMTTSIFAVDPNTSAAWDAAGIDAASYGVKVAS